MAKKNKSFTVMVDVILSTDINVSAESLEEALAKAKEFKVVDVVSFDGGHNDSSMNITGVYSNE